MQSAEPNFGGTGGRKDFDLTHGKETFQRGQNGMRVTRSSSKDTNGDRRKGIVPRLENHPSLPPADLKRRQRRKNRVEGTPHNQAREEEPRLKE